jgi:acetylornithine deacetylase/succinyl-diaminopimelate desuccinylase-like protein
MLQGSQRVSVIPAEVVCQVDVRILPGREPAACVACIRELLGPRVEVEPIEVGFQGLEVDPDSPLVASFRQSLAKLDPGATVAPFLASGSTDAVSLPGIKVYGFMPMALSPAEANGLHNHDERIAIDNLLFGTRALFEIVTRFCGAR